MVNSIIYFSFTRIQSGNRKNLTFHVISFNTDISITVIDVAMKIYNIMVLLYIHSEGTVSQISYYHLAVDIMHNFSEGPIQNIRKKYNDNGKSINICSCQYDIKVSIYISKCLL